VIAAGIAAGIAAYNILLAAHAFGLGGMWRTGAPAYDPQVGQALGFGADTMIVGFLYLGTPDTMPRPREPIDFRIYVNRWPRTHPA
jgi:nitroreductase